MLKKRSTKLLCLLIAFLWTTIVVGSSYAYFIDSVAVTGNVITAGNLKAGLEYMDKTTDEWKDASNATIFSHDRWEPGYTDVQYIRISNTGSLAFQYELNLAPDVQTILMDVIDVYYGEVEAGQRIQDRATFWQQVENGSLKKVGTLRELVNHEKNPHGANYGVLKAGQSETACLVLHMQEEAGNEYQNRSVGKGFQVQLFATQYMDEEDSFGKDYDQEADEAFPELEIPTSMVIEVQPVNGLVPYAVWFNDPTNGVSATVPAGAKMADGATSLTLVVAAKKDSEANVNVTNDEKVCAYNVKVEGLAEDNKAPVIINMGEVLPNGLNLGNYSLYHVEGGNTVQMTLVDSAAELDAHNEFTYDPVNGEVAVAMATFSEVALVADTEAKWEGNYDYSWYTNAVAAADGDTATEYTIANADQLAGFGAIVGGMNGQTQDSFDGKTVKLVADVNLGITEEEAENKIIFYPIGYNSSDGKYEKTGVAVTTGFYTFEGTFDGNGHTIKNFYQNTWEMKGDNNYYTPEEQYYRDGMGLFGKVYGGTVKNLTVDNFKSDGEYTTTGVITAYADFGATFENIAITHCNPRVYNTGNGGIVGCVGWYTEGTTDKKVSFNNITVDNTNKISALWGSYDVACGGLVGQYYPTNGQSVKNAGVDFVNCHVSAQIDVYNDVCGNYQYYAYRYAGMIIGSIRENTTKEIDGVTKTIPDMTGITATGCTVNYGDWNDYYYCEFEENSMASYSEDYQFSRVPNSEIDTTNGKENATCIGHNHTEAEDKQAVYLPFHQLFTGYSWGVSSIGLEKYGGIVTNLGITEGDQEVSVEKFKTKFTGDFLYRVGNDESTPVKLDSLFAAVDEEKYPISDSGVWVSIEAVDENMNVSGTFTANTTDWTKGTIQFTGTGVVKVTIQDYNFCTPTELYLEVVDAVNATTATSATKNNVVLLNDCGFSSLEVSGGYTLYGNGFIMTCGSDSAVLDTGYAFVTLNNGTLDNVQIVCPNFDYAALYKSNLTSSENRSETTDKTRYYNAKSGVMVSGNSQILNSRVSGGRAAVNVSGGNVVIDNSRIELGAVASVLVGSANSLTLRDVTLIQKPTVSTHDSSKTLMGFSVLYLCDSEGNATPTTIEGSFVQQAWVNADDKQYVPSAGQDIVDGVMKETAFIHNINGKDSLNLGFAYMPEDAQNSVEAPDNITDKRTDKATIPYEMKSVDIKISILSTTVYVYSYKNTKGTDDSFKTESEYVPNKYSDIITVTYSDTAEGLTAGKSFGTDGWVYELNVDLDKLSGYALDFSKLSMSVNGVTVTDYKVNGSDKPTSPVAVTAGGTTYTLTATVDGKEYTATYKVTGTETSKESPSLVASNYEAGLCVASSYGGTWHGAAPALEGIQIKYWSVAESQYKTINLSDYTPTTPGKQNGTNTTWTYSPDNGDFTLTLTGGQVHSGNSVYAMPVSVDSDSDNTADKLYFVASSSNGLVNSGNSARTIPVSYVFEDNNGGTPLKFSHTWSVEENKNAQYKYSDFCNGTLTQLTSGSGGGGSCLAAGTMITMADGSKRAVEDLRKGDAVMAFDHLTGEVTTNKVIIVVKTGSDFYQNTFAFDDGSKLVTINEHGIYDLNLNRYVNIDHLNAEGYIGHDYVAIDPHGQISTKKLVAVESEYINGYKYDIVSEGTLNYVAEDTLSVTHVLVDIINTFEFNDDMCYDQAKMEADIQKYGLYTYDEWQEYADISVFEEYNIPVMKVGVSKGMYTKEYIIGLINTFVLDDSVQIID